MATRSRPTCAPPLPGNPPSLSPRALGGRSGATLTAAAVAVAIPVAARATGVFDDHPLPAQILAVQLVNGILGVPGILEFHKAVAAGKEGRGS